MTKSVLFSTGPKGIAALLWVVNLCAIGASTLSYIYLSYFIYSKTSSVILSQVVMFSPMVLPIVFVFQIQRIADRVSPRALLIASNAIALLVCTVAFSVLESAPLAAIASAVAIGTLDALQRVARIVSVKRYFTSAEVKFTILLTLTAQFIAGGIAGAALGLIRGEMTPQVALVLTSLLFGAAFVAAVALPPVIRPAPASAAQAVSPRLLEVLRRHPSLRQSFWAFVVFVSVYQGFFNLARVTLPAHVLKLSEQYVGWLQVAGSMGALLGALAFHVLSKRNVTFAPSLLAVLSAILMFVSAAGVSVGMSFFAFFGFMFFFELAFFKLQSDVVLHSPSGDIPLIAAFQYAGVYSGMIATIFIGSLLVDHVGLLATSLVLGLAYLVHLGVHSLRAPPPSPIADEAAQDPTRKSAQKVRASADMCEPLRQGGDPS